MPKQKFMITPLETGLQTNIKPWIIPDDAFARLRNAQMYRSRVVKRFGTRWCYGAVPAPSSAGYSRLKYQIGTTNAAGIFPNPPLAFYQVPGNSWKVGEMFSVGTDVYTVYNNAAPFDLLCSNTATTGTYVLTNGRLIIASANPNTPVYWYPTEPVMGFLSLSDRHATNEETFAFDTQFPYSWDTTQWKKIGTSFPIGTNFDVWTGGTLNFFTGDMFRHDAIPTPSTEYNVLFVTNFKSDDHLRFYTPVAITNPAINANTWNDYLPKINATEFVLTARVIITFKNRLLLFNTIEGIPAGVVTPFPGRVRWSSRKVDPLHKVGAIYDAFKNDGLVPYQNDAGLLNSPTDEAITSVVNFKDHLIVIFEESIWELAYTYSEADVFIWKKINTSFGSKSILGSILFDDFILFVGSNGIFTCNGSVVQRIDLKIPDEVFKNISNNTDSETRIAGIRDFRAENAYWSFPSDKNISTSQFLKSILAFNYANQSWSIIDDSFTAFGYFREGFNSPAEQNYKKAIAGNQQGWISVIDNTIYRNAALLYIWGIIVVAGVINIFIKSHNLEVNDYIFLEGITQDPAFPGNLPDLNNKIFKVTQVVTTEHIRVLPDPLEVFSGAYAGKGTVAKVTPIDILTKDFNFFLEQGKKSYINNANFLFTKTTNGEVSIDVYGGTSSFGLSSEGITSGAKLGTMTIGSYPYAMLYNPALIDPYENSQQRLWHSAYLQAEGESVTFSFYLKDSSTRALSQVRNPLIAHSNFELHGIVIEAQPGNDIKQ